jgi:nucleotide-binding universal stress UspA family protein
MSPIRSILLHADASTPWNERLSYGARIASVLDADLTTLFAPNSAWVEHPIAMVSSPDAWAILHDADERRLREARAAYDAATRDLGGRLHWSEAGALSAELATTHGAFAADLVILGQQPPRPGPEGTVSRHFVESVIMDGGRPALVVPYIGTPANTEIALVAWKATRESARALTAAIPLLQRARRVYLATWTETDREPTSSPDILGYLRGHGIESTLRACGPAPARLGDAMLSLAADCSADLLVMGCYGHTRARERVLGGATRTILEGMTIPVLMAH